MLDRPIALAHGRASRRSRSRTARRVALGGAIALGDERRGRRAAAARASGRRRACTGLGDDRAARSLGARRPRARCAASRGDARRVAVFVRGELTLPTGDDHDFAGDARLDRGVEPDRPRRRCRHDIVARGDRRHPAARRRGRWSATGSSATSCVRGGARSGSRRSPAVVQPDQLRAPQSRRRGRRSTSRGQRGPSPVEVALGVVGAAAAGARDRRARRRRPRRPDRRAARARDGRARVAGRRRRVTPPGRRRARRPTTPGCSTRRIAAMPRGRRATAWAVGLRAGRAAAHRDRERRHARRDPRADARHVVELPGCGAFAEVGIDPRGRPAARSRGSARRRGCSCSSRYAAHSTVAPARSATGRARSPRSGSRRR